ncbi:hypothetical protein BDQ17DRAFT_1451618 [Cyathus striatus]|nr:hypothetical protein BDQ17DRAFT_1451618 [Cyathus striatus]
MMDYGLPKPIEEGVALDDRDLWMFEDDKSSSIKRYVDIDSMQEQLTDVPSPDAPLPWTSFLRREMKIFLELQVPLSNHANKTKYIYGQSSISSRKKYKSNVKKDNNENDDMEKAEENQSCLFISRKFKLKDNIEDSAKPTANKVNSFMKNSPHALSNATRKMGYDRSYQMIMEPMIPPKDLFGFQHRDIVAQNIQKETLLNIDDYYTSNINITFDQDEERRQMLMVTHNIVHLNELGEKNNCSH